MDRDSLIEKLLMYDSNELDAAQREHVQKLIEQDESVAELHSQYQQEKKSLFTSDILQEQPSAAINKKIVDACANGAVAQPTSTFFPVWLRRTLATSFLLIFGIAASGYLVYNLALYNFQDEGAPTAAAEQQNTVDQAGVAPRVVDAESSTPAAETLFVAKDSAQTGPALPYSHTRGSIDNAPVIPVNQR